MAEKYFDLDLDRCVGCFACVVACMDQNDTDVIIDRPFRQITPIDSCYTAKGKREYLSMACMHCEDAPCITGCPTGALRKDGNGLTVVEESLCIGCHSCAVACPYGAPKFDQEGRLRKCDGCAIRVENGLEPACVRVCPTGALKFDTQENLEEQKRAQLIRKITK
ncbi:4Fe-4S dicluster domain-containing protein [Parasporobacterium paucivorans]|uniref:Anaerobic dimethyl sulfoxide reductase subunit B (DMSO reductase iron-sulfur subunit) n=1 Tax=Parasporobacterium paucivorans DSM 15970 TaxID=1122934 RepID=A0A1M6IGW3_9FIRM|nr:4Fe-4S dicluster domain-containing protein [Parasporobacterium paucivorans]SHJ33683.1 anaerobic dimethyl sulfoxide reductase subunit B (DMSO reductase iron-sulfur subunit) [Parasporobacterium paucivorans DSM 15970]